MAPPWTPPTFQKLTFRIGSVDSAVFAPDGETILYSARWGKSPPEVFSTRAATRGSLSLGLTDALILAVSSREELAFLVRPRLSTWAVFEGTLARAPMAGGTPREVLEGVLDADWSPDGKDLAVIHVVGDRYRLEYPIGKVLYDPDPPTWMSNLRLSPRGDRVAFVEHPVPGDARGGIVVMGLDGQRRTLGLGVHGPRRHELVSERETRSGSAPPGPVAERIRSMPCRSRVESVCSMKWREHSGCSTCRVAARSWATSISGGTEVRARARGATEEAELPASDLSFLADLSDDGDAGARDGHGRGRRPELRFLPPEDRRLCSGVARRRRRAGPFAGRAFRAGGAGAREAAAAHRRSHGRRRDPHPRAWARRALFAGRLGPHRPTRRVLGIRRRRTWSASICRTPTGAHPGR